MEGFPEKRGPGLDRIVGIEAPEENILKIEHKLSVLRDEIPSRFEREPTDNEQLIILEVLERLPEFVKEYGADKAANVFLNQIHFIDGSNPDIRTLDSRWESGVEGRFDGVSGRVEILADSSDLLKTAHTLVHELIHANAFHSVTIVEDKEATSHSSSKNQFMIGRRGGLSVRKRGTEVDTPGEYFFEVIDEAVTEELTKRFCERFFGEIPLLQETFQKQKEYENPLLALIDEAEQPKTHKYYMSERIDLGILLDILYQKNQDIFDSYEEVFKLFSTAALTGRLLPLARLIEKTLGKDMLRKIGEATKEKSGALFSILRDFGEQEGVLKPKES